MLSEINKLIFKALGLVSEDKNQQAQEIVESILNNKQYLNKLDAYDWQYIAHISLAIGKFLQAQDAYKKANNFPGVAFILILLGKLDEAKNILMNTNQSPATIWCNFLIDLFSEKKIKSYPSFLFIRHFLEFTVYYLLLAKKVNYIELIFKNLNKLSDMNLDSEKLIGYAYFHYGEVDEAIKILNSSIEKNQFDGEVYFILGQAYLMRGAPFEALAMLENAQLLLPHHVPTKELLEETRAKVLNV